MQPMRRPWYNRLQQLERAGLTRRMRVLDGPVGPATSAAGSNKLVFCSNDYLGLANHPSVKQAMQTAVERWGVGAGASRLISGNTALHARLERAFATFAGSADAVLFASGYQANVGALTALTSENDVIFSDARVHASLIDGCRLSSARVQIFNHRDMGQLESLLAGETTAELRVIVTDAVFSMDGDLAPLAEICALAERYGAIVYLDEAHAMGVLGPRGTGLAAQLELTDRVAVRLGTLGKAFGVSGGVVCCREDAANLIRSKGRSLLYTTAAPIPVIAAALAGLELAQSADEQRAALVRNIDHFKSQAQSTKLPLLPSDTPIQPIMVGSNARTMALSEQLWNRGLFVQGVRPPTVAPGTARLRITLSAAHTEHQIDTLIRELNRAIKDISS